MANLRDRMRRSPRLLVGLAAFAGIVVVAATGAIASPDPATELRARDQAMLDAWGTGNKAAFEQALSADAIYIDENGGIYTRAELLSQVTPLPARVSGHIAIASWRLKVKGDTALVVHRDDESENWHGHALKAQYIMSETWWRENGAWKLALLHVYVVAKDPPAVLLPLPAIDAYAGRYKAAPELLDVIARDRDGLTLSYNGKKAKPLRVESPDMLFVPGEPRFRYIFERDRMGRITGFIERREGENILWSRVG